MHSNVTIKNVSWPHFSWPTLYMCKIMLALPRHHRLLRHISLMYISIHPKTETAREREREFICDKK